MSIPTYLEKSVMCIKLVIFELVKKISEVLTKRLHKRCLLNKFSLLGRALKIITVRKYLEGIYSHINECYAG